MVDMQSILSLIQSQSYLLIFILMIVEGPVTTAAASFVASLGFLNVYIIFILSFLGNFVPDFLLYYIGRFSRGEKVERYLEKFGLNKSKIKRFDSGFKKHAGKTLVFVKLTPLLPVPGLIIAGFTKVPVKRFFFIDATFNFISAIIATLIGFYFGLAANIIFKFFKIGEYTLLLIIPLILIFYLMYKKFSPKLIKNNKQK